MPRNNNNNNNQEPLLEEPEQEELENNNFANRNRNNNYQRGGGGHQQQQQNNLNTTKCCVPSNNCQSPNELIRMADLQDVVKVTCNNGQCNEGRFMHKPCFESWEESVLIYLRSCGRARSWSEKQRLQNLWNKKGYDLAFKACSCKCGRGHLRKDLDWTPPAAAQGVEGEPGDQAAGEKAKKKKKNKQKKNEKPSLIISTNLQTAPMQKPRSNSIQSIGEVSNSSTACSPPVHATTLLQNHQERNYHGGNSSQQQQQQFGRLRTFSMSSTGSATSGGGASPPICVSSVSSSPDLISMPTSINKLFFGEKGSLSGGVPNGGMMLRDHFANSLIGSSPPREKMYEKNVQIRPQPILQHQNSFSSNSSNGSLNGSMQSLAMNNLSNPRERHASGNIFSRRNDYSNFNTLPNHKINSYHIKMEDDIGCHGNDDTRSFLLATLSATRSNRLVIFWYL